MTSYVRAMELMEAPVADEMVALDREGTRCFGFNRTATSLWHYLEQPMTLQAIMERFAEEYDFDPAEAEVDIQSLLEQMCEMDLLCVAQQDGSAGPQPRTGVDDGKA